MPVLTGVTVLDLTRAVAGPFCTMILGDLGARIIKVEDPDGGDECRQWGPPFLGETSTYFLGLNRNKESLTLDLKSEAGRTRARALAQEADVLVENFRPGVMDRLGLSYEALSLTNPRLIYASVSGFGQTGRDRLRPGYDLIIQALSGLMTVSAVPSGPPVKTGFPVADVLAGLFTGQAILAALYARERDGQGRRIDVSLLESLLAAMCSVVPTYLFLGQEPGAVGLGLANIVPYQVFRCGPDYLVIGVPNERIWQRFCVALEQPGWLTDERFRNNGDRTRNRTFLVPAIEAVLATRPTSEWLIRLEQAEVPCAPLLTVGQALELPQLQDRESIMDVKGLPMLRSPIRYEDERLDYQPPPALNENKAAE